MKKKETRNKKEQKKKEQQEKKIEEKKEKKAYCRRFRTRTAGIKKNIGGGLSLEPLPLGSHYFVNGDELTDGPHMAVRPQKKLEIVPARSQRIQPSTRQAQ